MERSFAGKSGASVRVNQSATGSGTGGGMHVTMASKHTPAEKSGPGPLIAIIVLAVIALAIVAVFIWRAMTARPDPAVQVQKFLVAVKTMNKEEAKALGENGPNAQKLDQLTNKVFEQFPKLKPVYERTMSSLQFTVGKAVEKEDTATVPVTLSLPDTQAEQTTLTLKYIKGAWKIGDDNKDFGTALGKVTGPAVMKTPEGEAFVGALMRGEIHLDIMNN